MPSTMWRLRADDDLERHGALQVERIEKLAIPAIEEHVAAGSPTAADQRLKDARSKAFEDWHNHLGLMAPYRGPQLPSP
jgi:hypothetical protein